MNEQTEISKEYALESIITSALKLPGVKVSREEFLREEFSDDEEMLSSILETGPVQSGITQNQLQRITNKLILKRTSQSSAASFIAGLPGGATMAATIPLDVAQFFGMALRLAQEISYLYDAEDLWKNGEVDNEKIRNQLILYCGVMFGASGAVSGVRVLTAQMAKTALKKLPQKALTKTFWYPIVKQIGKLVGVKVTKNTVAKGVSKVIPVLGGVISGGLNFASMMPMANRLASTLDKAAFNYSEEEFNSDIETIEAFAEEVKNEAEGAVAESVPIKKKAAKGIKTIGTGIAGFVSRHTKGDVQKQTIEQPQEDIISKIERLSKLKEAGVITQEEFDAKKEELLSRI